MCVQTKTTKIGKARLRTSVFIHHSFVDTTHVAHTGTFEYFTGEVETRIEFTLDAVDTENLINALQAHLQNIKQATAELAATTQQEAA